jgi:hypothetical protein
MAFSSGLRSLCAAGTSPAIARMIETSSETVRPAMIFATYLPTTKRLKLPVGSGLRDQGRRQIILPAYSLSAGIGSVLVTMQVPSFVSIGSPDPAEPTTSISTSSTAAARSTRNVRRTPNRMAS